MAVDEDLREVLLLLVDRSVSESTSSDMEADEAEEDCEGDEVATAEDTEPAEFSSGRSGSESLALTGFFFDSRLSRLLWCLDDSFLGFLWSLWVESVAACLVTAVAATVAAAAALRRAIDEAELVALDEDEVDETSEVVERLSVAGDRTDDTALVVVVVFGTASNDASILLSATLIKKKRACS